MASPETQLSYSSKLQYSTTAAGTYTTIGGMKNFSQTLNNPQKNVSALEDTTDVFMAGRGNLGVISGDCYFRQTEFAFLWATWLAKTRLYWKVVFPNNATFGPFNGPLVDLGLQVPDDDAIMSNISIQASSVAGSTPTFTPGT